MINRKAVLSRILQNNSKLLTCDKKKKYHFLFRDRGTPERAHLPWGDAIYYYRFTIKGNHLRIHRIIYSAGIAPCVVSRMLLLKFPFADVDKFIDTFIRMTPELEWF